MNEMRDLTRLTLPDDTRPVIHYTLWECACGHLTEPAEGDELTQAGMDEHHAEGCAEREGWFYSIQRGRTRLFDFP